jgi:hypothetical protein
VVPSNENRQVGSRRAGAKVAMMAKSHHRHAHQPHYSWHENHGMHAGSQDVTLDAKNVGMVLRASGLGPARRFPLRTQPKHGPGPFARTHTQRKRAPAGLPASQNTGLAHLHAHTLSESARRQDCPPRTPGSCSCCSLCQRLVCCCRLGLSSSAAAPRACLPAAFLVVILPDAIALYA